MVFYGFLHQSNLFWREPTFKSGIGHQNLATGNMVDGTRTGKSQIVIGGNGVNHVDVSSSLLSQLQRTANNPRDVLRVMGTVKLLILGQYLRLDKLDKI